MAGGLLAQLVRKNDVAPMNEIVPPPPTIGRSNLIQKARLIGAIGVASNDTVKTTGFDQIAQSIVSQQEQFQKKKDPWLSVLRKVVQRNQQPTDGKTLSKLSQVVKSTIIAKRFNTVNPAATRSAVMDHWIKTSVLRNDHIDPVEEDEDDDSKKQSTFDLRLSSSNMQGRILLLEESCRRAFSVDGDRRSHVDLQALKAWFQTTKLKVTTDFERLQPVELDLLCRRMELLPSHANEVIFRQGDEGDALYIVFSGIVEVRVSQIILGEKVEVTVCELTKGDYFGERSLLSNENRAATVVTKAACELVRITREVYNIMLKKDQLEFIQRMQVTNPGEDVQTSQNEYLKILAKKKNMRTKGDIDLLSEYTQTLKFFRGLPKAFARELCAVLEYLAYPGNTVVFREGEVGDLFYIILSGSVDIYAKAKDTRGNVQETKLLNLTEGSHFGELALMKGHGIRSATVITREECKFLVICGKDYNSTLRRMQKEDLAKRVSILDKIPMFQTPEWTGELLKEMSFVLSEQKHPTGSVIFRQGDKAHQVYFVTRGEMIATKEMLDPVTNETHTVFVERIGQFRVVGDDAATGTHFNEVFYREETVTASTPVELLVLSKYDVFHRLSRAARETLKASANSRAESIVYYDRFYKSIKWNEYKQRTLGEHLNHERLSKILPQSNRVKPAQLVLSRPLIETGPSAKEMSASPSSKLTSDDSRPQKTGRMIDYITERNQLVKANEFLLLPPREHDINRNFPKKSTLPHYVTSFNPDAPPSQKRKELLNKAIEKESVMRYELLNEGNPFAYFDKNAMIKQTKKSDTKSNSRLLAPFSMENGSRESMNQFLQENFIYSLPYKTDQVEVSKLKSTRNSINEKMSRLRSASNSSHTGSEHRHHSTTAHVERGRSSGNYIVVNISVGDGYEHSECASFRIVQSASTPTDCERIMEQAMLGSTTRDTGTDPENYYMIAKQKFSLLPMPGRTVQLENAIHKNLIQRFGRQGKKRSTDEEATENLSSELSMFTSMHKMIPSSSLHENPKYLIELRRKIKTQERFFAVVSVVLSKHEIETSHFEEALLCVHEIFSSELKAMDYALGMPPVEMKNAVQCIVPLMEWINFADAYEWCVQVQADRRVKRKQSTLNKKDKRGNSLSSSTTTTTGTAGSSFEEETPLDERTEVQIQKEKAQRLHNFICLRVNTKQSEKDRQDDHGFTARPLITLETKLNSLHEYLEAATSSQSGSNAIIRFMRKFGVKN